MAAVLTLKQAAQPTLPSRPSQNDFRLLTVRSRRKLRRLADDLAANLLTPREWAEAVYQELLASHTSSWAMGRQLIGDTGPVGLIDAIRGRSVADSQADFLLRFLANIEDGDPRYVDPDGNIRADRVAGRSEWYTGRYRGSANEAMRENAPDEAYCLWVLGAVEAHCFDCPRLAALSEAYPFEKDTLFQVPGDNETPCKFNCKCHLEWYVDGDRIDGFSPV